MCQVSLQTNQVLTTFQESAKTHKKPQKHNLERNFKHFTIDFDSNHFKTITYTK